jgi:aryl-alcohol dehydrogenase-like predicted oxidoreductase
MKLTDFRTLGRSGPIISPMALGTMTMGTPRWGSPDEISEAIFNAYVDAGGNFIDTADVYAKGRSEELVGGYIAARSLRDKVVLATKYSFNADPGNPHAGGNGRKNLHRALEGSLRRLKTDYVDLFWMHVWDQVTPIEEVLQSMGDLVRSGKIRYFAFSDVPAWYAASAAMLARSQNIPSPVALQMPYSLIERGIEREHVPAAREFGMGITPWSPLAAGFLAGKYSRDAEGKVNTGGGRLDLNLPSFQMFTDRNWQVLDRVRAVADDAGLDMAKMALAWALAQPGISSLILGASKIEQLHSNLAALDLSLSPDTLKKLNEASGTDLTMMDRFFSPGLKKGVFGGADVTGWR